MNVISLDYDDTYTADPELFKAFADLAKSRGHIVVIVTARKESMPIPDVGCEVFYTNGKPKAQFMREQGLAVDIWVDDWPEVIGATR